MKTRTACALLALTLTLALTACAAEPAPDSGSTPPAEEPAGLRLAPGLYDLEDGTVQALGTLEYVELEGGFWAITGGTDAEGTAGETIAVIANGDEFAAQLASLTGKTVLVTGTRFEGVSIRMAGPEIVIATIEEITDTPGIAE